jgi:hypothetical protein
MTGDVTPEQRSETPEAGEAVHLPEPSYLPVLVALGVTLGVVGTTIAWPVSAVGALIALIAIVRWIRAAREEMGELPLGE